MLQLPNRYEHRQLLGAGGMGQVHLVFDRERNQTLALKTFLPAADQPAADREEARLLFKQEFWAMASLRHPHLVAAFDYGELADGTPFLTMEPVAGHDLPADAPQDEASIRAWLPGIASALAFLHSRGYVHGDLKPENIRLREDGLPKLMDLGLLARAGRAGGPIRGSLLYLAPEAIKQGAIDGRADLYALGAVLYHALTGRAPFEEATPVALLRAHLEREPEPLRTHAGGISRELESAVLRLLQKDPARRFASAAQVLEALGLEGTELGEAGLLGAPVIGREAAQARLHSLASEPLADAVVLVGAAGAGKTRLIGEARAEAQLAGAATLVAQGLGTDAPPYQAIRPWLQALTGTPSAERDRLAPILVRVLPELGVEPLPALEGAPEKIRLHVAIAELARAQVSAGVWIVDDVDRLDPASQELVGFLRRQGADRPWRWLVSAEAAWEDAEPLALDGLAEADTLVLARALLGQESLPGALTDRLPVLSGGNPAAIEALLGHWLRSGALRREAGAWVAGAESAFDLPGGLQVALDGRFQELPADAQQLGRIAALLGTQVPLALLSAVADLDEQAFFQSLAALEEAGVLSRDEADLRFDRPARAQALAASWDADAARQIHGRAATALARRLGEHPNDPSLPLGELLALARHLLASDRALDGVDWAIAAARRAIALFSVGVAEPLIAAALAVPGLAAEHAMRLNALKIEVLRVKGEIDEAVAIYDETLLPALRAAQSDTLAAQLVTYGILHQLKSRYPEAMAAYAEAINLADARQDRATGVRARLFAGRVAYFAGESAVAKTHMASAVRRAREAKLTGLLAGALSFNGYLLASTEASRRAEGLAQLEEAIAINRELGDLVEAQDALSNQGNLFLAAGQLSEARAAFEEGLAICERMGSANETIFALLNLGAVRFELGELQPVRTHAQKAIGLARAQGRKFPEGFLLALDGLATIYQGELAAGAERLQRGLAISREIANKYLELNVLVYWVEALVHLGRLEAAQNELLKARELAKATQNDEHNDRFARYETAIAVLQDAPDAAERLVALVERARAQNLPLGLAHALRWQAEWMLAHCDAGTAEMLLAEAAQLAKAAGLLLLQGEVAYARGRAALSEQAADVAADFFSLASGFAAPIGYRLGLILALAGVGQAQPGARAARLEAAKELNALLQPLDETERARFLIYADRAAVLARPEAPENGISLDRIHHLTELIATITLQPDLDAVKHQALAALVELAGAERGFLLLYEGLEVTEQIVHGEAEGEHDAFSSSLAYQVLWSGEPLYLEDAMGDADFAMRQSVQSLSLRSVVGVPLFDGQETIGVMLADSTRINTDFTPADMELAQALGRQVAIALTNARKLERYKKGFEELVLLHRLALETAGARTLEDFMAPVAAMAIDLTGADECCLLLGESLKCEVAFQMSGKADPRTREISQSISRWVYEQGEPLHLTDAQTDDTFQVQRSVMALGLRTICAVPVVYAGETHGVLYLQNQRLVDVPPGALHTLARVGELVGAYLFRAR